MDNTRILATVQAKNDEHAAVLLKANPVCEDLIHVHYEDKWGNRFWTCVELRQATMQAVCEVLEPWNHVVDRTYWRDGALVAVQFTEEAFAIDALHRDLVQLEMLGLSWGFTA